MERKESQKEILDGKMVDFEQTIKKTEKRMKGFDKALNAMHVETHGLV